MATTTTSTLNYSGLLKSKTDERTRLLDRIYSFGNGRKVNATEFALSSSYSLSSPSQPAISENDSLNAPAATTVERQQQTNCIQIFHYAVDVSYLKQSANGQMAGLNIAGDENNVPNELDFQISKKMAQMKLDLNYTVANGRYRYTANTPGTAAKTRGVIEGITTNAIDASAAAFSPALLSSAMEKVISNGGDETALEIWVNPKMLLVISEAYKSYGQSMPDSRTEAGMAYKTIITDFGILNVFWDNVIPDKTILLLNTSVMNIAELDVPGKGNVFYEELAKSGASEKGQLYAQLGVDYGPEWYHAKITNIGAGE